MKIFNITFPKSELIDAKDFYCKSKLSITFENNFLSFTQNQSISFETYFNCFSYSKIKKYTSIENVQLNLKFIGQFNFKIFCKNFKNKICLESCMLKHKNENTFVYDFSLKDLENNGYIYFELTALSDDCKLYSGNFSTTDIPTSQPKIGLNICTFKREQFVLKNLENLKNFFDKNIFYKDKFTTFVIDNGNSLKNHFNESNLPIEEKTNYFNLIDYNTKIFPNKNLGGSGGFTRGIVEIFESNENYTHFLNMDDDIVFDPNLFIKIYAMLAYAKNSPSLSIGGSMLILDNPYIQYEMGANWNGTTVKSLNGNLDLRQNANLLSNELDCHPNYNAWWFMCMPLSVVKKHNLPMPFFIKADDIEYGLRCIDDLLLLNGIGVWHENFNYKESDELNYYTIRNELILGAYTNTKIGKVLLKLIKSSNKHLFYQNYHALDLVYKAFDDFLEGAKFFDNYNAEKLHLELRKENPQAVKSVIPNDKLYEKKFSIFRFLIQIITLNGYLIPYCFYNKKEKNGRIIDITKPSLSKFFKSKKTIKYNPYYEFYVESYQDKSKLFYVIKNNLKFFFKLLFSYNKVKKDFVKNKSKITSFEFWNKQFDRKKAE